MKSFFIAIIMPVLSFFGWQVNTTDTEITDTSVSVESTVVRQEPLEDNQPPIMKVDIVDTQPSVVEAPAERDIVLKEPNDWKKEIGVYTAGLNYTHDFKSEIESVKKDTEQLLQATRMRMDVNAYAKNKFLAANDKTGLVETLIRTYDKESGVLGGHIIELESYFDSLSSSIKTLDNRMDVYSTAIDALERDDSSEYGAQFWADSAFSGSMNTIELDASIKTEADEIDRALKEIGLEQETVRNAKESFEREFLRVVDGLQ